MEIMEMGRKRRPRVDLSSPNQPRSSDFDELFTSGRGVEQASGMQLLAIRLDAIMPDTVQPRQTFSAESLAELSEASDRMALSSQLRWFKLRNSNIDSSMESDVGVLRKWPG